MLGPPVHVGCITNGESAAVALHSEKRVLHDDEHRMGLIEPRGGPVDTGLEIRSCASRLGKARRGVVERLANELDLSHAEAVRPENPDLDLLAQESPARAELIPNVERDWRGIVSIGH